MEKQLVTDQSGAGPLPKRTVLAGLRHTSAELEALKDDLLNVFNDPFYKDYATYVQEYHTIISTAHHSLYKLIRSLEGFTPAGEEGRL